jgi:hypothetical protein
MPDVVLELNTVNELASLTGFSITNIRSGLDACGIDVLFEIDGRPAGAQHTTYHWDEGATAGKRGSPARAKEQKISRNVTPYPMSVNPHYRAPLRRRVDNKIEKAAAYDNQDLETWLVISACLGRWGSLGSTMMVPDMLGAEDLNELCHAQLAASKFERAYLLLHINRIVWGWDRLKRWRLLADPDAAGRREHRERMSDLIFNRIPADFRARTKRP